MSDTDTQNAKEFLSGANFRSGDGVPEAPMNARTGHSVFFRAPNLQSHRGLMTPIEKVLFDVAYERVHQDRKWGADRNLVDRQWLPILVEEVGEVSEAILEEGGLRDELIQVAAVAVAWVECLDNNKAMQDSLRKKIKEMM